VAPLGSTDSLRELLDLVARHPGHKGIHPRLKPWLSAVGVNDMYCYTRKTEHESRADLTRRQENENGEFIIVN